MSALKLGLADMRVGGLWQVLLGARLGAAILAERGHLFPWVPVCLGTGMAVYFALPWEPGLALLAACLVVALIGAVAGRLAAPALATLILGAGLMAAGLGLAALRAQMVAAPVLEFRYYGPITGRIVDADRSAGDAPRLTLDQVVLDRLAPERTPDRVRVTVRGEVNDYLPVPGTVVMLTGHLGPPPGPPEPGDFDFRRQAWFEGLGALGYTASPVLTWETAPEGALALALSRLRLHLSLAIREAIPGDAGGLAAAVLTGDRSGLSIPASDAMRDSNLYHIVSISGTHMGMVVAFIFGLVRGAVALIPPLALRISGKKAAALVALPAAAFYLALAGRDIATERAFVMAAVMLGAVLADRQALSLRSVAIAALIVLVLRPEAVVSPGFQMSFAAVVALVWAWQGMDRVRPFMNGHWRWALPVLGLLLSSLVAGSATAPFAAAHFNRIAHYGLVANLVAVPVMGVLVMPAGVMLAVLGPLGLGAPAYWLIETGCDFVLWVAWEVAGWPGAVSAVPSPPDAVLPLVAAGGLALILWQGRARVVGLVPLVLAAVLWSGTERPAPIVAEGGGLVGLAGPEGRALSRDKGDGFAAGAWLENDGDVALQADAAARPGLVAVAGGQRAEVGGLQVLILRGERGLAVVPGCDGADVLIANVEVTDARPCLVLDEIALRETGSVALWPEADGVRLVTAAGLAGARPWSPQPKVAPPDRLAPGAPRVAQAAP